MRFVVITGMSGAGKSLAIKHMEDLGFFCVDNMPPNMMPKFFEAIQKGESKIEKVALVMDIRGGELFEELIPSIQKVKDSGFPLEVLFLDAKDEALVKRFKETRRSHPLSKTSTIKKGILEERNLLSNLKDFSNFIIDTSELSVKKLKEQISNIFGEKDSSQKITITVVSFGFKYGIPSDCDMCLDVRFIPNPFYIDSMKYLSGKDDKVKDFVLKSEETKIFILKTMELVEFLIPYYIREGKSQFIVAIGCTGGRHRSVAISEKIFEELSSKDFSITVEHRDIDKDNRRI